MSKVSAAPNRLQGRFRRVISRSVFIMLLMAIAFTCRPVRCYCRLCLGQFALSQGKYAEASANFRMAHDIDPTNAEILFWTARGCRKTGDLAGVVRCMNESQPLDYREKKRIHREWCLLLAETGRISEAEVHLPEMLVDPGDDGAEICDAFSKGYCLNLMFPAAQKLLDVWAVDFPEDFRPHLRRANIYAGSKQWALAIRELREAQRQAPEETGVLRELGSCFYRNGESDEAEKQLKTVINRDPADLSSLMNLAQITFDRNDYEISRGYLNRIVAAQPHDFPARLLLAKLCLATGDPARSADIAKSLVSEWPEDLSAHYVLAQALRTSGHPEDANRHFKIHGELDKNWARIETIGREMNHHPTDPQLRYELGILLLRHVSRSEGAAYLESVFQFVSTHPDAHRALADYYEQTGNSALSARHRQLANVGFSAGSASNPLSLTDRSE